MKNFCSDSQIQQEIAKLKEENAKLKSVDEIPGKKKNLSSHATRINPRFGVCSILSSLKYLQTRSRSQNRKLQVETAN